MNFRFRTPGCSFLSLRLLLALLSGLLPGAASAQVFFNNVHPLPPQAPSWLEGYQLRWPVRILGEPIKQTAQTVLIRVPTGGWLRPDAADLAVQSGSGKLLPLVVVSHDPRGETIVQFQRNGNDSWYWIYGVHSKTGTPAKVAPGLTVPGKVDPKTNPAFHEGMTLELRDWAGDDLASWVKVRAGLEKSAQIIGNAIVTEVTQNCNPARPDQSSKFAASYRGHLNITKGGMYSFVVNAEDASFLFIDGFKVFERPGSNQPLGTVKIKELEKISGKVDLKAGVHPFEVHQVVGENPQASGTCALAWTTPEQPKFALLPPTALAHPLYARVAALERPDGSPAGSFSYGLDDTLESGGLKLFMVHFEADGDFKEPGKLRWDFGDGTVGTGASVLHLYFKAGDYQVSLDAAAGLPAFQQKIHLWPEPGDSSPFSLERAVQTLEAMEWKKLDPARIREIFTFLQICEQPNRWPLVDQVTRHLLEQKDFDLEVRTQLITARMEALTQMGRAAEALKLAEHSAPAFAKTPVLQVRLQLGLAAIHQYHYKDAAAASKIYKTLLEEHKRVEHPNLRLAAVRWGDLFAESGDLVRASDTYRAAAQLGGEKFSGTALTEATTRGALMRIAEQKVKAGEIQASRQLLERIELEYPGRRLDGLYCFLRAETDRHAGRYEEALRHYEMIFKLPQWAGYRDRATFGIADCYYRMDQLAKSLQWYHTLKETFPKYHETQKGPEMTKIIEDRLERIKSATARGKPQEAFFKGFSTGFEPQESEWFGETTLAAVVRSPGLQGPHALLLDVYPQPGAAYEYVKPLRNLTPGGTYWVELWYRDIFRPAAPPTLGPAYLHTRLVAEPPSKEVTQSGHMDMHRNSHHQWHKLSGKIKAPLAQDCKLSISFNHHTGATLYDALSIHPVSDRQMDSLVNFLEGGKLP